MNHKDDYKISARKAYVIIEGILRKMKEESPFDINYKIDDKAEVYSGTTAASRDAINVTVGSRDVLKTQYWTIPPFSKIDIQDFVGLMVAAYHEKQHVVQEEMYITRNDEVTLKMAVESSAHYGNRNYYTQTYHSNLYEIDAERTGIKDAYEHLSELYGTKRAEKLMMNYIAERQKHEYFISEQCPSFRDVVKAFDKAFNRELAEKKYFQYRPVIQNGQFVKNEDIFYRNIIKNSDRQNHTHFQDIKDGWEQRQFMCVTNVMFAGHYSDLPRDHILLKQDWIDNYDMLPTRKETFKIANEEAERLTALSRTPDLLPANPTATELAIADGMPILNSIMEYGTRCNHSAEVLESIGVCLTDAFKDKLQDIDFKNINKDKPRVQNLTFRDGQPVL